MTRARILAAAETLLAAQGYAGWTMKELASEAGCAVGLVYRYFPTREALVLGLYADLARTIDERVDELAPGSVGERFVDLVGQKLAELDRRPRVFRALAHAALAPGESTSVFAPDTASVRAAGLRAFSRVVEGASNAPADGEGLGRLLYGAHLFVILLWTQWPARPRARAGADPLTALLRDLCPLLDLAVAASATPFFSPYWRRLDALARSLLETPS